ncbi:MAG: DNA repair protein [Candidatus Coproplasma sp.]
MEKQRTYLCIDMKSFYASVECAERNISPFETNLVVADESRGNGAITLAISPKLKSLGVKNRCRLFEIPKDIDYIIAKPRMSLYIKYCADIFEIYLDYFSQDDIHQYSIDEAFIDVTDYLSIYKLTAKQLAKKLINEIALKTHIPATCGIGTNLFLAKIALDITAKHCKDHIGELTEETFKETLWEHRPINDFWNIAKGTANRLARFGIYDLKGVANAPEEILYRHFGKNAKILIDHANGKESCTIADIKKYKSKSKSISNSQILFSDYEYDKAKIVIQEMALNGCQRLIREHLIASHVGIFVGYSKDVIPASGGTKKLLNSTNLYLFIREYVDEIFEETTAKDVPIRRLGISFSGLADESAEGYDLFTDFEAIEKERRLEHAVLEIKDRFGKNAMLRAFDLQEGATQVERNKLIGGHNGGE